MIQILRGLPGSGKSRYAANFSSEETRIFSADNYIVEMFGGQYTPANIGEAHKRCFASYTEYVRLMRKSENIQVIVDNTNTTAWEISPYMAAANSYGHKAEIIYFHCDIITSFKRNTHNVPLSVIMNMNKNLLEPLPPFWSQKLAE